MESFAAELARFDPELPLRASRTPPKSWYTQPAFHDREAHRVFHRNWQVAARAAEVAEPGDYVTGTIAGAPFVVVRDTAGELCAFHNVCRHKATVVAVGSGRCSEFTCPYHGWRYELGGRLKSAPELGGVEGFDRDAHGLRPVRVAEAGALVFVALGGEPRSLDDDVAPIADLLAQAARMTWVASKEYELACNWKVYVDNYLDGGYHIAHLHKGLADELELDSYRTELFERVSLQTSGAAPVGGERIGERADYAFAYPNWMVNRYGRIFDLNRVEPLGPDRTRVIFDWWFEPAAAADAGFVAASLAKTERIQLEDVDICAQVQRGLASPAYDRGPYAVPREAAEHHFHRLLFADLTDSP